MNEKASVHVDTVKHMAFMISEEAKGNILDQKLHFDITCFYSAATPVSTCFRCVVFV